MILLFFIILDNPFDMAIRDFFQRNRTPFLDKTFTIITKSADKEVFLVSEVILSNFFSEHEREDAKLLLFGVGLSSLSVLTLKVLFKRKRPSGELKSAFDYAFPSGHATGSFSFAYILSKRHKNLKFLLYSWAFLVGISRIYLDRHWTTDVLAGIVIGTFWGYLVMKNERKILDFKIK
ncbi:MAG: phosphatase PAP2 family protein [Candidatus Hydrothermales bacterium]